MSAPREETTLKAAVTSSQTVTGHTAWTESQLAALWRSSDNQHCDVRLFKAA